jgi:type I restriction enzyme M protein
VPLRIIIYLGKCIRHGICDAYLTFQETEQSKIFPNAAFGYWKVTVERPLRLHSRLSTKAIESLRFNSGDEDLRAPLYAEFGNKLFENFDKVHTALEKRLADWGDADEEEDAEEGTSKKGLPEKKKKRLLDPKTWERDAQLVETANALRKEIGGELFEDHNIFRNRVEDALKELGIKLSAADLKTILKAVSWREETAPPVVANPTSPVGLGAGPDLLVAIIPQHPNPPLISLSCDQRGFLLAFSALHGARRLCFPP